MNPPVAATTKRTDRPKVRRRCLGALGGGGGEVEDEDDEDDEVEGAIGVAAGVTTGATLIVEVVPAGRGVEES